jgi:hypothetical protein
MSGTKVTRENASEALTVLAPVLDWLMIYHPFGWLALRMVASFGAPLSRQRAMIEGMLKAGNAPAELYAALEAGWPLYVAEEEEGQ